MNITAIRYGATVCPKQFQSERLDIDATIGEGQTAAEAVRDAVKFVHESLGAPLPERLNGAETKAAEKPVDTNAAPAANKPSSATQLAGDASAPAKKVKKKPGPKPGSKRKKKAEPPKEEAPKPHPEVVTAEDMHVAIVTSETPEALTEAFNKARLNWAEFDDWAETVHTAREQFKAINSSYTSRGEEAPGNDAEWADFIKAMNAEWKDMHRAARKWNL